MNVPKFNAEYSLYHSTNHYITYSNPIVNPGEVVIPTYFPDGGTMTICEDWLENKCPEAALICQLTAAGIATAACIATLGTGCAAAAAYLASAWIACEAGYAGCIAYGLAEKCCPKLCGVPNPFQPGSGCCEEGEECVAQGDHYARNGCCPVDQYVCGGVCCMPGAVCCGDSCCDPGSICCGDSCCPLGHNCSDGVCCPPGTNTICKGVCCGGECDANNECCQPPGHVCNGKCCIGPCCNGECMDVDSVCIANSPCPKSRACNDVCCPIGQHCEDGICVNCPEGTKPTRCEGSGPMSACCPPNTGCCEGKCCPAPTQPGESVTCCTPKKRDYPPFDNFEYGCHHTSVCIA